MSGNTMKRTNSDEKVGDIGCFLVIAIVLAISGVISVVQHLTAGPNTFTLPNFRGQSCESATARLSKLAQSDEFTNYTYQTIGLNPDCGSNVVLSTNPAAGAVLHIGDPTVEWDVIDKDAYDFYTSHPRMPNLVGKALVPNYDSSVDTAFMTEVADDRLVQIQPDGGFYVAGKHLIRRTVPAPGRPLQMGQPMTIFTQIQRGRYVSGAGGSGGSNPGDHDHLHFFACVRLGIFHVCS